MMTISKQRMTCKCGEVFDAETITNAPLEVVTASLKSIRCPKCGAHKCALGGNYTDAPSVKSAIEERILWWAERGERGISSNTIYAAMTGGYMYGACYPYDPDDYRRCRFLLDLIPEWRAKLDEISVRFPWMKPFVDRWDQFDLLWDQESPSKRCPKLYALMQAAQDESNKIRGRKIEW